MRIFKSVEEGCEEEGHLVSCTEVSIGEGGFKNSESRIETYCLGFQSRFGKDKEAMKNLGIFWSTV